MGGLVQQVNLYRGESEAVTVSGSTRALLLAAVAAVVVVLVMAGAGELYLSDVQRQRDAVADKLDAQRAELEQFRQTLSAPAVDPFLESEIVSLRTQQRLLDTNLLMISRARQAGAQDVSDFFAGLARNRLDGLWFDAVGLSAGGSEVLLRGRTTQPALVPRLLQILAGEQAFAGRTFRKVSFLRSDRDDHDSPVEFELRSASSEEVSDAG